MLSIFYGIQWGIKLGPHYSAKMLINMMIEALRMVSDARNAMSRNRTMPYYEEPYNNQIGLIIRLRDLSIKLSSLDIYCPPISDPLKRNSLTEWQSFLTEIIPLTNNGEVDRARNLGRVYLPQSPLGNNKKDRIRSKKVAKTLNRFLNASKERIKKLGVICLILY